MHPPTEIRDNKQELNDWLETQVNMTSTVIDVDEEIQFRKNSPALHTLIPNKLGSIYDIAKDLIDDDKLSVCRDTRIMKKKRSNSPHRSSRSSHSSGTATCRKNKFPE